MKALEQKPFKDFPKCPEGQHIAKLVGLIDMGTQNIVFQGQTKQSPQIYLQFEVYAEDDDGKLIADDFGNPFLVGQQFTASMSSKSKLLPFVNAWRGKPLEEKDFPFDFSRMLGRYGLITIAHNKDKADEKKVYANIGGLVPVPKKLAVDPQGNSLLPDGVAIPFFFNLDGDDWEGELKKYDGRLWDNMKKKIALSPEFQYRSGRVSETPEEAQARKEAEDQMGDDPAF